MKLNESEQLATRDDMQLLRSDIRAWRERMHRFFLRLWAAMVIGFLIMTVMLLASCSSLGKPELQRSSQAPSCNQRAPALDSGDPPESTDWMAWAQWGVAAQWAIVDRDNKRAATADCLDQLARIKP